MASTPQPVGRFEQGVASPLPAPPNQEVSYSVTFSNRFSAAPKLVVGVNLFQVSAHGGSGVIVAQITDIVIQKTGFQCKLRANITPGSVGWIQDAKIEWAAYG